MSIAQRHRGKIKNKGSCVIRVLRRLTAVRNTESSLADSPRAALSHWSLLTALVLAKHPPFDFAQNVEFEGKLEPSKDAVCRRYDTYG